MGGKLRLAVAIFVLISIVAPLIIVMMKGEPTNEDRDEQSLGKEPATLPDYAENAPYIMAAILIVLSMPHMTIVGVLALLIAGALIYRYVA